MELTRRSYVVYGLLLAVWLLVVGWQIEEHFRFKAYAKTSLRNRSRAIANTLGASIRGLQWWGAVVSDRLQPVLNELVSPRTDELNQSTEVLSIALLNAAGEALASAGRKIDFQQTDILQEGERWGRTSVTMVYPIEGATVPQQGVTNTVAPILLPRFTNNPREGPRPFPRREARPADADSTNSSGTHEIVGSETNTVRRPPPPPGEREGGRDPDGRPRRPFWARGMNEKDYQGMIEKRELHGLIVALSLENFEAVTRHDLWLRFIIGFFAGVAVFGSGLAWREIAKSSELQIRLVRASELNSHLREMNLAAAGLAHETRNPLNIIRGLAQVISKQAELAPEIRTRSKEIVQEADKVAAQLNEFINYSRPREVRRTPVDLLSVANEVVRALNYDLEEKGVTVQVANGSVRIEADEQLLRQALFNLLLNAVQAVERGGAIQVLVEKRNSSEAWLDVRDNGPGVPLERRTEIFKPYFTTQKTGTGLGLAVVQQIVLAHGWEIQCLPNEPKGALFRITHLKLV
jgi:signal transduction histidine kinase